MKKWDIVLGELREKQKVVKRDEEKRDGFCAYCYRLEEQIQEFEGLYPKPVGLFVKKCPNCSGKLNHEKPTNGSEYWSCSKCGYEYAKCYHTPPDGALFG